MYRKSVAHLPIKVTDSTTIVDIDDDDAEGMIRLYLLIVGSSVRCVLQCGSLDYTNRTATVASDGDATLPSHCHQLSAVRLAMWLSQVHQLHNNCSS